MATAYHENASTKKFLVVSCVCGRSLRAKLEQAGGTVQCWECHRVVPVPFPRSAERVLRTLNRGLHDVLSMPYLAALALGAVVVSGALLLSGMGRLLPALLLVDVAIGYGVLIRRVGLWGPGDVGPRPGFHRWDIARVLVTLGVCVLVVSPWLVTQRGLSATPRLHGAGAAIGAIVAILVPLAMLITWGPLGPMKTLKVLRHHLVATFFCLLIVPLALVAAELIAVFVASYFGMFSFFLIDLLPNSQVMLAKHGVILAGRYYYPVIPEPGYLSAYAEYLGLGYPLWTTIPASLAAPYTWFTAPMILDSDETIYLLIRMAITVAVGFVILTALAIQARWLGLIARLDCREALLV
jgi:hypothetical protein